MTSVSLHFLFLICLINISDYILALAFCNHGVAHLKEHAKPVNVENLHDRKENQLYPNDWLEVIEIIWEPDFCDNRVYVKGQHRKSRVEPADHHKREED